MKRNVAVLESIRELNDMFYEAGDIIKDEYEKTKEQFPLPGEKLSKGNKGLEGAIHSAIEGKFAQIFSVAEPHSAGTLSIVR